VTQGLTQQNVSSRIEKIIGEQIGNESTLSPETNLQNDLEMDSLELVDLGITLEKEFEVVLPDSAIRRCATLGDVVQMVLHAEPEGHVKSV